MSDEVIGESEQPATDNEVRESEILRREFPAEVSASGDGRTLYLRVVPYNRVARVSDPPYFEPYDEMWMPGAFNKQLSAPNRVSVFVNVEHEPGIKGVVGRGTALREVSDDGLHGTFRMLNHPDADKALELVNEGDLTGVSLEFAPIKSKRENGVVKRVAARLINVALVRPSGSSGGIQAYKEAGVLAVRETPEPEPDPSEPEPDPPSPPDDPAPDPEVESDADAALMRIGYAPLLVRAITRKPWDGSAARFTDEQYAKSCLIDRGGDMAVKQRCSLPVLEPNGDVNVNAMGAAAGALVGARGGLGNVTMPMKAAAARKLLRYYRQAKMPPPPALTSLAAR